MKRFKQLFKATLLAFLCSLTTPVSAGLSVDPLLLTKMDSVQISLLTCGPGGKAYELYGHTAHRIEGYDFTFTDSRGREHTFKDVAVNWGMFSFKENNFYLKFVLGYTDYHIAIEPMFAFLEEYEDEGRWVRQQVLNLSQEEKASILAAVIKNDEPQNSVYRYNYFYDNCTTRAAHMIADHIGGQMIVEDADCDALPHPTFRECIHQYNEKQRWARMGNDLLLGLMSDCGITQEQTRFLPINLMNFYEQAAIQEGDSARRLCVESKIILEDDGRHIFSTYNTPLRVFGFFFMLTLILTGYEKKFHWDLWPMDAVLLLITGVGGLILTLMIFSQHPTVRLNLQILFFNPVSLAVLWPLSKKMRYRQYHWFWKFYATCIFLFLIGNFFQNYAEAMNFLALSLLIRCLRHLHTDNS